MPATADLDARTRRRHHPGADEPCTKGYGGDGEDTLIELTMNFALKFLHLLALLLSAAAGFGAMAVARRMRGAATVSADLSALRPRLAGLMLAGVALLWLSGLGLWLFRYDLADLGPLYSLKMVAALALLGAALAAERIHARGARNNTAPPAWISGLGMATSLLMLAAMALAVWVFV